MAIKRSFDVKNQKQRICLKCEALLPLEAMQDNTICTCGQCGQQMTVDRLGQRAVLTVAERPDIRRRVPPEVTEASLKEGMRILVLMDENKRLNEQIVKMQNEILHYQRQATKWEENAEGLARLVEELLQKKDAPGV